MKRRKKALFETSAYRLGYEEGRKLGAPSYEKHRELMAGKERIKAGYMATVYNRYLHEMVDLGHFKITEKND